VEYADNWRELMFRINDPVAIHFKNIFLQDFRIYNKYVFEKQSYVNTIKYKDFEILRDVPSLARQRIRKRFMSLIQSSEHELIIETPYFLPGINLRKAMIDASKKGVDVKVLLPLHSDMRLIDLLRNRYIGLLCKHNIHFLFYKPGNLHAKMMLVDRKTFVIASSNFDYRSFRYQHEIALLGTEPAVTKLVINHVLETFKDSEPFNYNYWLKRPFVDKLFERILIPFRHLF
jgi:cardiolipin synthase